MNSRSNLHTELQSGFTTGTCAAAVAKAATFMLINQKEVNHISVTLPDGQSVIMELIKTNYCQSSASCSVIKDAGDDPDVTHGIEIIASASFSDNIGVSISAGKGIGTVTKPGLAVEIGKPAINPVPLKMITESVAELLPKEKGINIILTVPTGEQIAQKTFNPRLGIKGGISILGTSGIVKPMSEDALKDSLVIKLKQLVAYGYTTAVFSPGNYGKAFSKQQFSYSEDKTVLTSNYIGFMLEQAVRNNFKTIVIVGHIGKLIKLAGGIFNTHSRVADARNEILASHYFKFSNDADAFLQIMNSNTTEEASNFITKSEFWDYMAETIKHKAQQYIYNELTVEVVLFSQQRGELGRTNKAISTINTLMNE